MRWSLINSFRRFARTSFIKSAYLNFKMLKFREAIKFPIIVSKYTYFYSLSGRIKLSEPANFGMVRIGYMGEDVVVPKNERALLYLDGLLTVGHNVRIGCGAIIRIQLGAYLILEDDVRISAKTRIISYDKIRIGKNSGISWECQIIDSNMHELENLDNTQKTPMSKPIIIGRNCWIGNRCTIMKGTMLPDFTIVSSSSYCNSHYKIPCFSVIAGQPAKLVKSGIKRADFKISDSNEQISNHEI